MCCGIKLEECPRAACVKQRSEVIQESTQSSTPALMLQIVLFFMFLVYLYVPVHECVISICLRVNVSSNHCNDLMCH